MEFGRLLIGTGGWETGRQTLERELTVLALQFTNHVILTPVPQLPPLGRRSYQYRTQRDVIWINRVSMYKDFITVPGIS